LNFQLGEVKPEEFIKDLKDLKGFGALRLKLYLELSFRILKKLYVLILNFISSRRRPKSLTPDPSPKGEGSRIKDLKGFWGASLEIVFRIII